MTDQSFWFFEEFDLFEMICPTKFSERNDKTQDDKVVKYKKGTNIYIPEENADRIFIIASGRIKIGVYNNNGKEIIKTILDKGEVFGELAMIGQEKRTEFAYAMEDTVTCVCTMDEMRALMKSNNSLQGYMMSVIGKRVLSVEKRLESLVFKDSRTRIVEYLIDLVNTRGQRVGYELLVRKFNTHQEIANLTATSRQTVTTLLNDLRNKNILTFDRKRLLVRDIDQLKKEALAEA